MCDISFGNFITQDIDISCDHGNRKGVSCLYNGYTLIRHYVDLGIPTQKLLRNGSYSTFVHTRIRCNSHNSAKIAFTLG
jgi:hypothetical protein